MSKKGLLLGSLLLLLGFAAPPANAWRCQRGMVDTGDRAGSVRQKCGKPDFVYSPLGLYRRGHFSAINEDWYYNAGSSQLLRVLHFHKGALDSIDTPGYGFDTRGAQRCIPQDIRSGMSVYELAARCGNPWKKRDISAYLHGVRGSRGEVMLRTEQWTYDFGPQYLFQQVTIANGQVQGVETTARKSRNPGSRRRHGGRGG
ncbi:MAG: DUF2845 domain-containing protein [Gammaproteobacteria bacterium]|nr:DUF2845 domain-containing protein [Gammaproteobacteria bacterium]